MGIGKYVVVVLLISQAGLAQDQTIAIQTKSYIGRMVTQESESTGRPDAATTKALGFDNLIGGRVQAYELMLATDLLFRENPKDGTRDSNDYRLWSELSITATCKKGQLLKWSVRSPSMAFGKEGSLQASGELLAPLTVIPAQSGNTPQAQLKFRYAVNGRPHALTLAAFENVQPRGCSWIWHQVEGTASCSGDVLRVEPRLTGSAFPSHRLWRNGKVIFESPQGAFDNLWKCSSTSGVVQ